MGRPREGNPRGCRGERDDRTGACVDPGDLGGAARVGPRGEGGPFRTRSASAGNPLCTTAALDRSHTALDVKLDLAEGSPFERRVWDVTRRVRYGTVVSYGTLAARIGVPGGARAVGNALGKNPVPIVVPCHRVIHGDKSIGGFSSGLKWKRFLLELERGQLELGWERGREKGSRIA